MPFLKTSKSWVFSLFFLISFSPYGFALKQKDLGGFLHSKHQNVPGCFECHESKNPRKNLFEVKQCLNCHEDHQKLRMQGILLKMSLRGSQLTFAKLPSEIEFSHSKHQDLSCVKCHLNYLRDEKKWKKGYKIRRKNRFLPTRVQSSHKMVFDHGVCLNCHQSTKKPSTKCSSCHKKDPFFKLNSHKMNWIQSHGFEFTSMNPKQRQDQCFICHQTKDCSNCHKHNPPKNHGVCWVNKRHGMESSMNRRSCMVCHTSNDCISCHENNRPISHRLSYEKSHCISCHGNGRSQQISNECTICHRQTNHRTANKRPTVVPRFGSFPWPEHHVNHSNNCINCHLDGGGFGATIMKHPIKEGCINCHLLE